jgi:hypothetical protein
MMRDPSSSALAALGIQSSGFRLRAPSFAALSLTPAKRLNLARGDLVRDLFGKNVNAAHDNEWPEISGQWSVSQMGDEKQRREDLRVGYKFGVILEHVPTSGRFAGTMDFDFILLRVAFVRRMTRAHEVNFDSQNMRMNYAHELCD